MTSDIVITNPDATSQDLERLARFESQAFNYSAEASLEWLRAQHEWGGVRVARRGGRVVGGLVRIPMAQFFGGRAVSMDGVAGVAISPTERGRGVAKQLMGTTLKEMRRRRVAVSTLYPSTYQLYGSLGYGRAGARYRMSLPLARLGRVKTSAVEIREMEPKDERAVERFYRRRALSHNGWLDRGGYIWARVRNPRGGTPFGYVVERPTPKGPQLEGYVYYLHHPSNGLPYELQMHDVQFATPEAGQRLLALMSDYATVADRACWYGGADDALLHSLLEQGARQELSELWMLRIVHLEAALEERGYPRGPDLSLEFEVRDGLLRANSGRWRLVIGRGRGTVERVRGPRSSAASARSAKLDICDLASLYSGHIRARTLAELGRLDARPSVVDSLEAVFCGPAPSLPDYF